MSIIMDRVSDLRAVDWEELPVNQLDDWEREACEHNIACRCQKCALLFARMSPLAFDKVRTCAIKKDIVIALRDRLRMVGKL